MVGGGDNCHRNWTTGRAGRPGVGSICTLHLPVPHHVRIADTAAAKEGP